ncbi:MAG: tRNA (adenosine(37)-N6)-dimethylallyltransferase MiaA [Candidatus Sumerlaeia bacterium]|nr:tRNA (adenosine(37)-N6)-dimethylallyltransferase MiaA [Candidatus Sumerlaeia bacterium]
MKNQNNRPMVGILGGPTASGKSAMAVEIAKKHGLAVISADSMQVYRGMEVGTGLIPISERQNVPHFLLGVAEPGEDYHAARFVVEARQVANQQWQEYGRRSLIVGGTGLWIQALREGLIDGPGRDETIRRELREVLHREGPNALHRKLKDFDPVLHERLSPRDHVRVLRAIEVYQLTGRPLSDWYAED